MEDLHQITMLAKERFPGKPVILFGHSMGSLVVRKYIKKYDHEIDKLIVCGSPSANPLVGAALAMVRAEKAIKGDRHRSMTIQKLAFGSYTKNLSGSLSGNAWLSVDTDNVKNYDKDKMCGFVFTLNGFRNLFLLMKQVYDPKGWAVRNPDIPIFFWPAVMILLSPEKKTGIRARIFCVSSDIKMFREFCTRGCATRYSTKRLMMTYTIIYLSLQKADDSNEQTYEDSIQ